MKTLWQVTLEIVSELNVPVGEIVTLLSRHKELSDLPPTQLGAQRYIEALVAQTAAICRVERRIVSWLAQHIPADLLQKAAEMVKEVEYYGE